jgi:single-strand DNA-binding protein
MDDLLILVGNLGKDPKVKATDNGVVTYLSVALNKKYGEEKRTAWFTIQVRNKLAETCGDYLKKGSKVLVRGTLEIGKNAEGTEFIYIRARGVKFLDKKAS